MSHRPSRYMRLLSYARERWIGLSVVGVLTGVLALVGAAQPWAMKILVENTGTQFDGNVINALTRWAAASGLAASPDYVVGSVHALTEDGSLLIASASGSQLGPLVSGAEHVILVMGAQKIVRDVATGMRRIYEYCYPLEDARARRAYGVPSGVNNILIVNKVITPGRITAIIVNERLGF